MSIATILPCATVKLMIDIGVAVTDEIWNEAAKHYGEAALAALVVSIATVNLWNRVNASTRQAAGSWMP